MSQETIDFVSTHFKFSFNNRIFFDSDISQINILKIVKKSPENGKNVLICLTKFDKLKDNKKTAAKKSKLVKMPKNDKSEEKMSKSDYLKYKNVEKKETKNDSGLEQSLTKPENSFGVKVFLLCNEHLNTSNADKEIVNKYFNQIHVDDYINLTIHFLCTHKKWTSLTPSQLESIMVANKQILHEYNIPEQIKKNFLLNTDPNTIVQLVMSSLKNNEFTLKESNDVIQKMDENVLLLYLGEEIKKCSTNIKEVISIILQVKPEFYKLLLNLKIKSAQQKLIILEQQMYKDEQSIDNQVNFILSDSDKINSFTCGLCVTNTISHIYKKCYHVVCKECSIQVKNVNNCCPYCKSKNETIQIFK
jgi:hypothetical protein